MAMRRVIPLRIHARGISTVSEEYHRLAVELKLKKDPAQTAAAQHLDAVLGATLRPQWVQQVHKGLFPHRKNHGLYLHGSVGTGKTLLLDCFHRVASKSHGKGSIRRCHFHDFMLDVHKRLHTCDIQSVSESLAQQSKVVCFDEFQVTDVADAVVLHRLFRTLFARGVNVVATSNRKPDELYKNGLNRQALFEPFLRLMKQRMEVVDINGLGAATDYRRLARESCDLVDPPVFVHSLEEFNERFIRLSGCSIDEAEEKVVEVDMGRSFRMRKFANGVGRVEFEDLCMANVGATDYMSIAKRCHTLLIQGVPRIELTRSVQFNFTRRFITLIDILYDANVRLILQADVPLDDMFASEEGDTTIAEMDPNGEDTGTMQSAEIFVNGEGGSSGNSTTMLGSDFEWSATGRMDASLAALSANNDVGFAIQRARSRLMEMQTYGYWQRAEERPSLVQHHSRSIQRPYEVKGQGLSASSSIREGSRVPPHLKIDSR